MLRFIPAGVLGLIALAVSLPSFGQTVSNQSRDRRLEATETEIGLLRRLVKDQDRRIAELEKIVKLLQVAENPTPHELAKAITPPAQRWQNPLAWAQIREGLSRAQVEEILGQPSSVESVIDYQTLLYKGEVTGSGNVSGSIKLTDDRVSDVSPPKF